MKILRLNPRLIPPRPFFRRAGYASRARSYKTLRPLSSVHSAQRRPPQEQSPLLKHSKDGSPVPNTNESSLPVEAISQALRDTNAADNTLLAPVHIAKDPNAILTENHPATHILANSAIVVKRKLELMNVLLGFEQANQYMILDPQGNHLGYIAERDLGTGNRVARQVFTTHRSFTAHVFDKDGKEVLRIHRPFSWVSSNIGVYDPLEVGSQHQTSSKSLNSATSEVKSSEAGQIVTQVSPLELSEMRMIGEAHQEWAPLRRKYNLFLFRESDNSENESSVPQLPSGELPISTSKKVQVQQKSPAGSSGNFDQFAYVDEPALSWDFSLLAADSRLIGSVNRNFSGFGRELLTDTGVYALRMDVAGLAAEPSHKDSKTGQTKEIAHDASGPGMTLDQRAVMLATAVCVDFDYFSRHGGVAGGFIPLWIPGGGGGGSSGEVGEAAGGAGAEAAGGAMIGAGAAAAAQSAGTYAGGMGGEGAMGGSEPIGGGASPGGGPGASSPSQFPGSSAENDDMGDEDLWGENDSDPWNNKGGDGGGGDWNNKGGDGGGGYGGDGGGGGDSGGGGGDGGGGGGGGGGGWGDWFSDFFG